MTYVRFADVESSAFTLMVLIKYSKIDIKIMQI